MKSLFKKLDPTVVKSPTDVNGEIELSFKFDEKRQLLLVKVIKCRDLHAKDIRRKASDPYVRVSITFYTFVSSTNVFFMQPLLEHTV